MANARDLIENDLDDPESFDVNSHFQSPVARLAATNGFIRDDRSPDEERWVKKLSDGSEAWLRTRPHHPDFDSHAFDPADPVRTGGREWELVLVKPNRKTGERDFTQLIAAKEMHMSFLLGAFLQRLATWPRGVRKPRLKEARRPKIPLPDPDDPEAVVNTFVTSKVPYLPEYTRLARLLTEHPEIYIRGRIIRSDHHYVHENTTTFSLEMLDMPPEVDTEETGKLVNAVEVLIQEECVSINHKIYRALEREWDWINSDESVDEMMEANLYTFKRNGEEGGRIPFANLSAAAKTVARDWYRSDGFDYQWWDHIYDEWKEELKEMGFDGSDIAFSGFSSQGDGASFTADGFDFLKWANWHMSNKTTERGHPYTDDLFLKEGIDDPVSKEHVIHMGRAGECQELCPICGAYCTLNHYVLPSGIQMPQYHICQTCDTEAATVGVESFEEGIDDPPAKEALMLMGRATECIHPCHICGASCTLVHSGTGRDSLLPDEHICQTCDQERFERMLRPDEETGTHHLPKVRESDDPAPIRKRQTKRERLAAELASNPEILALDDPTTMLNQEVERRSEPIKKLEVRGRRWWRRGAGGMYCTASIYINDKLVHTTPMQGGSGDHYLTLAMDWLRRQGYLEGLLDERDPIWLLRDKHGIDLQYGAVDVRRERDL